MKYYMLILILLLQCTGCTLFAPKPEKTAYELAEEGIQDFNKRDYKEAIDSFRKLKDWYPFSKYAILAELKIADAHYILEEYDEAILAYQDFANLHPRNKEMPYVLYQTGMCYFKQVDTIDRDQSTAIKALDTFARLQKQFPNDGYSRQAKDHIQKCMKSITGHEYYVGRFYFRSKHFKAARQRFKNVVLHYPDAGYHEKCLQYMTECSNKIKEKEAAPQKGS